MKNVMFLLSTDWAYYSHRFELTRRLLKKGYRVTIGTKYVNYRKVIESAGLYTAHVPYERSLKNPIADSFAVLRIVHLVAKTKPQIVHTVALKPILTSILAVVIFKKVKFVHAFAGMGHLFSSNDSSAKIMRKFVVAFLKFITNRENCWILVQNNDDKELVSKLGFADSSRVRVIGGSGIDTEMYKPIPGVVDTSSQTSVVVLPARMVLNKGIVEYVEAARIVLSRRADVKFVLAGALDYDSVGAVTKKQLDQWQKEGIVEWVGHVNDVHDIYKEAAIVCLPSYREGLPRALLEAASYGKALISTDVPGCREICLDECTGLLVKERDVSTLVTAIERLLDDKTLIDKYGQSARAYVVEKFSIDSIVDQTDSFYKSILTCSL